MKFEKRAPNDADDVACIISIIRAPFHQFGGIRLQPLCFFRVFYDGFWLAPGGVKLKMTISGPNPWFWAQNHGFEPDVVTFGVNLSKTAKNDIIWPKPRFWAREPGFGHFGCSVREPKKICCLRCPPLGAAP